MGGAAPMSDHGWVALDFETATSRRASACAIGLVYARRRRIVGTENFLIQPPGNAYSGFNISIHGIDPSMTRDSPTFAELWPTLEDRIGGRPVVAHNASFDMSVLRHELDRLDLGRRPLWLAAQPAQPIALPIHQRYDFAMPAIPAAQVEEIIAEKLARYRRASLARDLYDLAWFASRPFDEALVRRLTVLKVWHDVVGEGLGDAPFTAEQVLRQRTEREFQPEALGYLTTPVDIPRWVTAVAARFAFLRDLDDFERRVALCSRGDEWQVRQAVAELRLSV